MVNLKRLASRITETGEKMGKSFNKPAKTKMKSKRILKSSKTTLTIPKKEYPSILADPNRFFKDELEETKRSMYFK